jgi:hypothetical protein
MTAVPWEVRTLILNASVALTTVQSELSVQRTFFSSRGLELPAEIIVLDRLVSSLQTIFDYSTRHGYTLDGAIEAMGRDLEAEMKKLNDRIERMKKAVLN